MTDKTEPKERGAAAIHISLSKGIITVRHSNEHGPVLQIWEANTGDWDALWKTIIALQLTGGQV